MHEQLLLSANRITYLAVVLARKICWRSEWNNARSLV